jgi:hypothetical protein
LGLHLRSAHDVGKNQGEILGSRGPSRRRRNRVDVRRPRCGESASLFRPALAVARAQQAKSWELRAGGSGAIRASGEEAREPLAPVYERFTEGFDTLDLKEAKAIWLMGQCSVFVRNRELFAREPFGITADEPFVEELTELVTKLAMGGLLQAN